MMRVLGLVVAFVLVLAFTACGGSGQDAAGAAGGQAQSGSEAKTEAEPAQGAEEWDPSVENIFEYENGQLLMENESVRFTATSLVNHQAEKGMMVTVNLKIENLTDSPVKIRMYRDGKAKQSWVANLDPGEVYERDTVPVYDWNGKVDAGEESFLEHCMVRATMDDRDIGAAVFDLYASKTTPFVNINTDLEEIASTWGELKDPIDVTGELHENASSDDSASNETTKKDTSSEVVRIVVAFVITTINVFACVIMFSFAVVSKEVGMVNGVFDYGKYKYEKAKREVIIILVMTAFTMITIIFGHCIFDFIIQLVKS